ncbi:hypothetical protein N018_11245 [Pseudomonas syringae CC1557]|uniref:Histidine-specific methyltransferase SAM-dependent domain-containing protein n=1 Tax=Pseudomonas syringae CC1557 TaxID=1357279 RepID=W0MUS2_PSESX|nr:hypothetical protein [Pseudomonas syringae]AHG40793.1 hypothetical protein N018_11245 [Pseudomonas syringae CC1557]
MSISELVLKALRGCKGFESAQIWSVENEEKYSTLKSGRVTRSPSNLVSEEIFSLMHRLNHEGIFTQGLCSGIGGQGSLGRTLAALGEHLAALARGKKVHYVELGPEPVKTSQLVRALRTDDSGMVLYTAVDINETSELSMKEAISPLLSDGNDFRYMAANYHHLLRPDIDRQQDLTLITMLGFQEGNEMPEVIGKLLGNLGGRTTYVVSEMQLYVDGNNKHIFDFYENDYMATFSRLVSQLQSVQTIGDHIVTLLTIPVLGREIYAAVTLQPGRRDGVLGCLITNICLKYTLEQFRAIRQYQGLSVTDEFLTGDGSVVYQLARFNDQTQSVRRTF